MSDIVDRLRGKYEIGPDGEFGHRDFSKFIPAISLEAADEITRLRDENFRLRRKFAIHYAGSFLYADDGELQDNRAMPFIDFKRDTLDEIEAKMLERFSKEAK